MKKAWMLPKNEAGVGWRQWFQNIFPLAKVSFAKGKMFGAGRHPTGPK